MQEDEDRCHRQSLRIFTPCERSGACFGSVPASPRKLHKGCCAATSLSIVTAGCPGYVAEITRVLSQTRHLSVTNNEGLRGQKRYAIDAGMSASSYTSAHHCNLRESAQPDASTVCEDVQMLGSKSHRQWISDRRYVASARSEEDPASAVLNEKRTGKNSPISGLAKPLVRQGDRMVGVTGIEPVTPTMST